MPARYGPISIWPGPEFGTSNVRQISNFTHGRRSRASYWSCMSFQRASAQPFSGPAPCGRPLMLETLPPPNPVKSHRSNVAFYTFQPSSFFLVFLSSLYHHHHHHRRRHRQASDHSLSAPYRPPPQDALTPRLSFASSSATSISCSLFDSLARVPTIRCRLSRTSKPVTRASPSTRHRIGLMRTLRATKACAPVCPASHLLSHQQTK